MYQTCSDLWCSLSWCRLVVSLLLFATCQWKAISAQRWTHASPSRLKLGCTLRSSAQKWHALANKVAIIRQPCSNSICSCKAITANGNSSACRCLHRCFFGALTCSTSCHAVVSILLHPVVRYHSSITASCKCIECVTTYPIKDEMVAVYGKLTFRQHASAFLTSSIRNIGYNLKSE